MIHGGGGGGGGGGGAAAAVVLLLLLLLPIGSHPILCLCHDHNGKWVQQVTHRHQSRVQDKMRAQLRAALSLEAPGEIEDILLTAATFEDVLHADIRGRHHRP